MKPKTLFRAILSVAVFVAACSDSVPDSAEELCNSLEALHDTIEQIAGADVSADSTTVESIQNAVSEIEPVVQDVLDAESDLSGSLKSQLQDDFDELKNSIQGISEDSTLVEAGQGVVSALATFKQSWVQTLSELDCSTER